MDYERRRMTWYWVTLFVIYCMVMIYVVLTGNPYLYTHQEFKHELQSAPEQNPEPVPSVASQLPLPKSLGEQTYRSRMNAERNGDAPSDTTFGKNFVEKQVSPIVADSDFKLSLWSADHDGFYLASSDKALGYNLDGQKIWEFRFAEPGKPLSDIISDGGLVYMIQSNGGIVALNKLNGQLQWSNKLRDEVVGPSFISKGRLLIPLKSRTQTDGKAPRPMFRFAVIKRETGELQQYSKPLEAKPGFQISMAPELDIWILSYDNKMVAVDPEKLEAVWTQTLTDPILGPVSVVGKSFFVSTMAGKVIKMDGSKKARQEWEVELPRPPVSAPTWLPIMTKLSVLDDQGQLQLIDAKVGKLLWRYNIENKNDLRESWSARLKGSVIQEMTMDWVHRGWSIWSPCSKNRFCIYNPAKGQLISRTSLSGSVASFPIEKDKVFYFLIDQGKNWAISKVESEKHTAPSANAPTP